MAKEQWHNWLRAAVILAGIIFAGGGYAMKIASIDKDVEKNEVEIEQNEDDIVKLQLRDKDLASMAEKSLTVMSQVNAKLDTIQTTQTAQAIVQATNSEKLQHLTKDCLWHIKEKRRSEPKRLK